MPTSPRILVIDDESVNLEALELLLGRAGYQVTPCASGEEALTRLDKQSPFDLVLSDLTLPGLSGIDILRRVKEMSPQTPVILITGNATAESAVEAMKQGAFDYILKPFDFEKLKLQVAKAVEQGRLLAENTRLRQQLHARYRFDNIIGHSQAMQRVFSQLAKVVATDSTVLITGESGTGKELVAKAIHFNGPRKAKPFIAINCGAIPAELLESELFGHVKGAFTGAINDKAGKFEAAGGGTIFLDEIGTMPLHLQTKLLRVLQEHEVERVGSSRPIKLDVRVISATNADLLAEVKAGRFREDLYYRLHVIPLQLPPLRDRAADILLLARHFGDTLCREMNRPEISFSREAMRLLELYEWPGNVRELENVVERTIALADGPLITPEDLPPDISGLAAEAGTDTIAPEVTEEGLDMPATVAAIERRMIEQALELAGGVKARAARLLGLNRTTLVEKMKRLGMEV